MSEIAPKTEYDIVSTYTPEEVIAILQKNIMERATVAIDFIRPFWDRYSGRYRYFEGTIDGLTFKICHKQYRLHQSFRLADPIIRGKATKTENGSSIHIISDPPIDFFNLSLVIVIILLALSLSLYSVPVAITSVFILAGIVLYIKFSHDIRLRKDREKLTTLFNVDFSSSA